MSLTKIPWMNNKPTPTDVVEFDKQEHLRAHLMGGGCFHQGKSLLTCVVCQFTLENHMDVEYPGDPYEYTPWMLWDAFCHDELFESHFRIHQRGFILAYRHFNVWFDPRYPKQQFLETPIHIVKDFQNASALAMLPEEDTYID